MNNLPLKAFQRVRCSTDLPQKHDAANFKRHRKKRMVPRRRKAWHPCTTLRRGGVVCVPGGGLFQSPFSPVGGGAHGAGVQWGSSLGRWRVVGVGVPVGVRFLWAVWGSPGGVRLLPPLPRCRCCLAALRAPRAVGAAESLVYWAVPVVLVVHPRPKFARGKFRHLPQRREFPTNPPPPFSSRHQGRWAPKGLASSSVDKDT